MRFLFLILLFLSPIAQAKPGFSVISWQEEATLNEVGKSSVIMIEGEARELPRGMAVSSLSIAFDEKQNIKINRVVCDNQNINYSFSDNVLKVNFPKPKASSERASIYLSYDEKYDKINSSLRQEMIYVPDFAAGANAKVTIKYPWYMESATLNPNVVSTANSFTYSNVVPADGVQEIIKLTALQSSWDVKVNAAMFSNKSFANIVAKVPLHFQDSYRQKIENYSISSSSPPVLQKITNDGATMNFKTSADKVVITNRAKITVGQNYRKTVLDRNFNDYNKASAEEVTLLGSLVEQIKKDPKNNNLPLYAKIGKFVNEYIKYDGSYAGRLLSLQEILSGRMGVCTEYAKLYSALLRVAGIPALTMKGAACGEYEKCEFHVWNLIYNNGRWIEVDPTWNLMSGIVSSSHIYLYEDGTKEVEVEYFDRNQVVDFKTDLEMKQVG